MGSGDYTREEIEELRDNLECCLYGYLAGDIEEEWVGDAAGEVLAEAESYTCQGEEIPISVCVRWAEACDAEGEECAKALRRHSEFFRNCH